jgi:hypothetical protein
MYVGGKLMVTAVGGMKIGIASGRAWFNHTWTYNDSDMVLDVKFAESILNRIDALVLEVDARDESRMNSIKFIYGTPASVPGRPALIKQEYINQYPLAYIYVGQGVTSIIQANITNMIGTNECPFVTAPLEILNSSALLAQWVSQGQKQQSDWQIQTNAQQNTFDLTHNTFRAFYAEMLLMYQSIETLSFALINNNFDDISTMRGCDKLTVFGSSVITETVTVVDLDLVLATRKTTFNANGSITEEIQFNPWIREEAPNEIESTSFLIVQNTVFNANGSITQPIR